MISSDRSIDPALAFQALQQYVSTEISRLYGEIAARDAYIQKLLDELSPRDEQPADK